MPKLAMLRVNAPPLIASSKGNPTNDFNGVLRQANLIGSTKSGADSGDTIAVTNPKTGAVMGQVPNCGSAETDRAIAAVEKVEEMIADATSKGGKIVSGGKRHQKGGTFFEPTVITDATADMQFATEEIFGPLFGVFRFETEKEAIDAANATEFGLAAYAYTKSLGRTFRLNEGRQYGLIGINSALITTVEAPFGGLKESGTGKEGGSQGLEDYLSVKYMCVAGLDA